MRPVSSLLALMLLAACSRQSPEAPSAPATGAPNASAGAATAAAARGEPRKVKEENDLYDFEYAYPAAVGAIPALKAELDADLAKQHDQLIADAKSQRAANKQEGIPYNALGRWIDWQVVTDLPGWLSLSASVGTYEGGAHPNHGFDTILWDRQAGQRRDPVALFTSKQALGQAIRAEFCRALDRQRAEKRGAPVPAGSSDEFDQCIDPLESTVILGSSNHQTFDRIGVLVAPYNAGPYAEGDYEVTLPVTAAVLKAVKPEFRANFAAKR